MSTTGYTVTINGTQVFIEAGSLQVDSTIGKRSTASFTMHDTTGMMHLQQYQQVSVYDASAVLVFSGYVDLPKEQKPGYLPPLTHTVSCIDQHFLADKRRVANIYINKTTGYIAQDLVNTILSQEGVTVGLIYDGIVPSPTLYPSTQLFPGGNVGPIPSATFVYSTVAQALDELVKQASSAGVPYYWQIDQYKRLYFCPYDAIINNTLVDGSQIDMATTPPSVQRHNPAYRNTQYITGGVAQTLTQTETRLGDGHVTAWTMGYELASTPTITVDGVAKKVGVKGSTGADFYWGPKDALITQDSAGTKLTSANVLQIVYVGQYPTVIISQNGAQVSYEASIDGTTGIVEDVVDNPVITSLANGLSLASQLLSRYSAQGTILEFTTLQAGFAQGQLIPVNLPMFALNNVQMLIESVSVSDQHDGINLWYTVKAILGPYDITWSDFWSKLLKQQVGASSINAGVSQTLTLFSQFNITVAPTIGLTGYSYACPLPSSTLYPSNTLLPC